MTPLRTTGERDRPDMEGTSGTVVSTAASSDKDKKKQSILSRMTSRMKQDSRAGSELSREPSMMSTASANVAIAPASNRIWMEGIMLVMVMTRYVNKYSVGREVHLIFTNDTGLRIAL